MKECVSSVDLTAPVKLKTPCKIPTRPCNFNGSIKNSSLFVFLCSKVSLCKSSLFIHFLCFLTKIPPYLLPHTFYIFFTSFVKLTTFNVNELEEIYFILSYHSVAFLLMEVILWTFFVQFFITFLYVYNIFSKLILHLFKIGLRNVWQKNCDKLYLNT